MSGEDWSLGQSLDAFDDMLHGGYGAIAGREAVTLLWRDSDGCRARLGLATTRAHLLAKLEMPATYDADLIARQLVALDAGVGRTYFETVLAIIADNPNIALVPA